MDGPHTIIQAGQNSYVRLDNRRRNRWGDYSGASPDPDGIGIWIHGEFAAAAQNTWGTWVALTHRARATADLMPIGSEPGTFPFCRANQVIVRVRNAGGIVAPGSVTTVDFGGFGSVDTATPEVPPDSFVDLAPINTPPGCFDPDCGFGITVDSRNNVDEGVDGEANNTASGSCLG